MDHGKALLAFLRTQFMCILSHVVFPCISRPMISSYYFWSFSILSLIDSPRFTSWIPAAWTTISKWTLEEILGKNPHVSSNWACCLQAGAGCMWTAAIHSAVLLKARSWRHQESWVMWWVWGQGSIVCGCQVDGWILDAANFSSAWFASLSSPGAPNAVIQVNHNSLQDLKLLDTQDSDGSFFFFL